MISADLTSLGVVKATLLEKARLIKKTHRLPLLKAAGYVLSEKIIACIDVPAFDNSAMDGYAIAFKDRLLKLPISQLIAAGDCPACLPKGTAARILTGAPLPKGADTVVAQENVHCDEGFVTCLQEPLLGQHVRPAGQSAKKGHVLLHPYQRLTPQALGLIASVGCDQVSVLKPLKVGLFFTGDELQEPGSLCEPYQIYNANRYWLLPYLQSMGCEVIDIGVIPDQLQATQEALQTGARVADIVLTCGGVSVGDKDFVKDALKSLGTLSLWKVAIKPGKPFAFGAIGQADFIGLPGNPVSSFVAFELLVKPFLLARQGILKDPLSLKAQAAFSVNKADEYRDEFLRVKLIQQDDHYVAEPYPDQSSAVFESCVFADGLAHIPQGHTVCVGDWVRVLPFGLS